MIQMQVGASGIGRQSFDMTITAVIAQKADAAAAGIQCKMIRKHGISRSVVCGEDRQIQADQQKKRDDNADKLFQRDHPA